MKQSTNKCNFKSAKLSRWAFPSYHEAHGLLCALNARRVARNLHMLVPWSLGRTCWRQLVAQWGEIVQESRIESLNVIFTIITITRRRTCLPFPWSICKYSQRLILTEARREGRSWQSGEDSTPKGGGCELMSRLILLSMQNYNNTHIYVGT